MNTAKIEPIARRLLGEPNRALSTKTELRYGTKGSLAIDLKKDAWYDHEGREGGGVLGLVVRERGGNRRDAARWLEGDSRVLGNRSAPNSHDRITAKLEKKQEDKRRRKEAIDIWDASTPAQHTPAEEYLRCRGIMIQPPACIRYHAGQNALVAILQARDGTFSGIQRVFLTTDSRGTWKRPMENPKRSLGPISGGACRLTPVASTLQLTESIEDGLALLQLTGKPTWAVPGAGFMEGFRPPPEVRQVILAPDHDVAGLKAIEATVKGAVGVRLKRLLPPEGKDWCDVLEDYDERAAILEYDGEETRDTAEQRAWVEAFPDGG